MKIKFSKALYNKKSILSAISAFAELADFSFSEDEHYFIVGIEDMDSDVRNDLKDEFCNYALALMK